MSCELCKGSDIESFRTRLDDCGFKIKSNDVPGMLDEVADFVEIMSNFTKKILREQK